ncbi:replication factor A1 [Acrasis kona]|uniref:Replication protein A subunit n=1 Tax=Acrasis kona TaxID=1008807 RepID=A0AAW2YY05_9EUKA
MQAPQLTTCLADFVKNLSWTVGMQPVLQVIKKTDFGSGKFKAIISDGVNQTLSVCNNSSGDIEDLDIIRVTYAVYGKIKEKRLPIITTYEKIQGHGRIIGSPTQISVGTASPSAPQSKAPPQAAPTPSNLPPRGNQTRPSTASSKNAYTPTKNKGPIAYNSNHASISENDAIPFKKLNEYEKNWVIKGRVTTKSQIKEWKKAEGNSGRLFSVDLIDGDKDEIRVVGFNECVDKYFDLFQVGEVFLISKGKLRHANRNFSPINFPYEITLDQNSIVELVGNDQSIPKATYNLVKLTDLRSLEDNKVIDVAGLVDSIDQCKPYTTKAKKETFRRAMRLLAPGPGNSTVSVTLTLWGQAAQEVKVGEKDIVICKSVRKSSFDDVSLNSISSTVIVKEDVPEVEYIRTWYQKQFDEGSTAIVQNLSRPRERSDKPRDVMEGLRVKGLGSDADNVDFVTVRGTVTFIKDGTMYYDACPRKECNGKKVTIDGDGFSCRTCGHIDSCLRRYIMSFVVNDHTGHQWVTGFDDVGQLVLGCKANDIHEMRDVNEKKDMDRFEKTIFNANFNSYILNMKCQLSQMQGGMGSTEPKPKFTVMSASKVDYATESKILLAKIAEYDKL